jgi:hypothetical protein
MHQVSTAERGETPAGVGDSQDELSVVLVERQVVLAAAALMVAAQVALRAWALYPSWFYTDDYRFLSDARTQRFGVDYLTRPFDNQFMPLGRAIAYWVSHSGNANWALTASIVVALQLLASVACAWMLITVFGARWGVLLPLGVFLSTAVTMPALMWWSASLNQLPLQFAFFVAVGAWVQYLRLRRFRWLFVTLLVLAIGLTSYVKTVLVFVVLAFVAVAYFTEGRSLRRLRAALRAYWLAVLSAGALGMAFTVYYVTQVPSIYHHPTWKLAGQLGDTMVGTAFGSGVVGGPWRWNNSNPPVGFSDAPGWAVSAAWVLVVVLALGLALRRERTGRAWLLLGGYLAAAYALVLTSRAPVGGAAIGLEYRYLTDVMPVAALALGLATMTVPGAAGSSAVRRRPLLLVTPPPRLVAVLVAVVLVGGTISSMSYARTWHDDNPGADYTSAIRNGLRNQGPVDLVDQQVPDTVIPGFSAPYNTTRRLLPLLVDNARFPEVTQRLVVLDDAGNPRQALINPATTSRPGPTRECGWLLQSGALTIPLGSSTFNFSWWLRIGYLSSGSDVVTVQAGDDHVIAPLEGGVHSVFINVTGSFDHVTLSGLAPGTSLCVDQIDVGAPVPGGEL